jgi:hypothetical protein
MTSSYGFLDAGSPTCNRHSRNPDEQHSADFNDFLGPPVEESRHLLRDRRSDRREIAGIGVRGGRAKIVHCTGIPSGAVRRRIYSGSCLRTVSSFRPMRRRCLAELSRGGNEHIVRPHCARRNGRRVFGRQCGLHGRALANGAGLSSGNCRLKWLAVAGPSRHSRNGTPAARPVRKATGLPWRQPSYRRKAHPLTFRRR